MSELTEVGTAVVLQECAPKMISLTCNTNDTGSGWIEGLQECRSWLGLGVVLEKS